VALACLAGCERAAATKPAANATSQPASAPGDRVVVVYAALDRQFSEPILEAFTAKTGIRVLPEFDTESTKTVGLANRLRAEVGRPRCDVFWNNEILNTLRLKREGLLQPCHPPEAEHYPAFARDPENCWFGFAARARVLLVNTQLVAEEQTPESIRELADERWRGRAGIAKPLFGTTASHVACLFAKLGDDAATDLLASFRKNEIQVVAGNKACAELVGSGQLALGLTDTDDAIAEVEAGHPVELVFPDDGPDDLGTLVLPNTLALVKGCPHRAAGIELINYLLSPEVEGQLAAGPAAQIPLNANTTVQSRVIDFDELNPMQVDFAQAAELFPVAAKVVEEQFLAP
jgi:iron(III) transport system substrate-binding protein